MKIFFFFFLRYSFNSYSLISITKNMFKSLLLKTSSKFTMYMKLLLWEWKSCQNHYPLIELYLVTPLKIHKKIQKKKKFISPFLLFLLLLLLLVLILLMFFNSFYLMLKRYRETWYMLNFIEGKNKGWYNRIYTNFDFILLFVTFYWNRIESLYFWCDIK